MKQDNKIVMYRFAFKEDYSVEIFDVPQDQATYFYRLEGDQDSRYPVELLWHAPEPKFLGFASPEPYLEMVSK